ncbi:MAG: hypothetical protein K9L68_09305 [Spirochaetales bacterium]|nr:hypothetical protein [Spirochaetales bacterium]MCF7938782.1 hypothetical protein [Spirochaetales bacterium]
MNEKRGNEDRMNLGQKVIDWLYRDRWQVEETRAVCGRDGFTWWPGDFSQTIRMAGEEIGAHGETCYLITVETDLFRYTPPQDGDRTLFSIFSMLMRNTTLSGVVFRREEERITLNTSVRIYHETYREISRLIEAAAALQIGEAQRLQKSLYALPYLTIAMNSPPAGGSFPGPHPVTRVIDEEFLPAGRLPVALRPEDFEQAAMEIASYGYGSPPAYRDAGLRVKFPFLGAMSLVLLKADLGHPFYGNGLRVVQALPVNPATEEDGHALAMALNHESLTSSPYGHGMGSYTFMEGYLSFVAYFPNAILEWVDLANQVFSCAGRALDLERRFRTGFTGNGGNIEGFGTSVRLNERMLGIGEN